MIAPRFAGNILFAAILCVATGCKPSAAPQTAQDQAGGEPSSQSLPPGATHRPPSTGELAGYLHGYSSPVLKLLDFKNDPPVPMPGTAPGGNVWSINVRLTFAPTEDVLASPLPPLPQAFQATVDELTGLAEWSRAYAQSPYASLYPGFSVDPPVPAAPQLLRILHPKDRPCPPVYGKLAAEWQVDHWQYEVMDMGMPAQDGQFRPAFTGPVMIQGEPATERFLAAARAAIAQAKPKKEAIERRYHEDLLAATRPGTLYLGQVSRGKNTMPAEVRFLDPSSGNDPGLTRFELRLPASGYVYTCSAKLAREVPNMPVPPRHTDDPFPPPVEPAPEGDLTINYEHVNQPKFNLADGLANDLLYCDAEVHNAPLSLRKGQLQGAVALLPVPIPIVLAAQQSP